MNDRVFVSYSRRDSDVVLPIVDQLAAEGIRVWLDQSSIPVSVPWMDEINQAVRGAVVVLVCESLDWHSSSSCMVELQLATQLGKRIVYVDPHETGTGEVVSRVRQSLAEVTTGERVAGELLSRSFRWSRGGRRGRDLAAGRKLRSYRVVQRAAEQAGYCDPAASAFVRSSRRRRRLRVVLGVAASLMTGILLGTPSVLDETNEEVDRRLSEASAEYTQEAAARRAISFNGYAGLAEALALTENERDAFGPRSILTDALAVPLPTSYISDPTALGPAPLTTRHGLLRAEITDGPDRVSVYDRDGRLVRRLDARGPVTAIAWRPDGRQVAFADSSGVEVVDVRRGTTVANLGGTNTVTALRWRGSWTVVGWTTDGHRAAWSLGSATELGHDSAWWFMDTAQDQDGTLAAVSREGSIVVVDPAGRQARVLTRLAKVQANAIAPSPEGWLVVDSGERPGLVVVRRDGGQRYVQTPDCDPLDVAWHSGLGVAVVGCADGNYGLWQPSNGELQMKEGVLMQASTAEPYGEEVVLTGGIVEFATVDAQGEVEILRPGYVGCLGGSRKLAVHQPSRSIFSVGVGFRSGCSQQLVPSEDGITSQHLFVPGIDAAEARGLAISHDQSLVALGASNGEIRVFRPGDYASVQSDHVTGSEIRGVDFTHDDSALIVVTRDGDVLRVPLDEAHQTMDEAREQAQDRLDQGLRWGLFNHVSE